jgi:hypothetical protein
MRLYGNIPDNYSVNRQIIELLIILLLETTPLTHSQAQLFSFIARFTFYVNRVEVNTTRNIP